MLAARLQAILDMLWRTLFPPDPGSVRLTGAARAALGGLLTLGCGIALKSAMPMPFPARVLGFAVATFLGAMVRDPRLRQQAITLAIAPFVVFVTVALAALALVVPRLPDLLTLVAVFLAIATAACGPRWAALGAVSLTGLLIALLSRFTLADLPADAVMLVLAAAGAALARFVILPDRPAARRRRLAGAVRRAMADILSTIAAALQHGGWRATDRRRLRRGVARLSEAVMLLQPLLAADAALHLLECDLLMERVARMALLDLGGGPQRPALLGRLVELRAAVLTDAPMAPPPPQSGQLGGVLAALSLLLARPAIAAPASSLLQVPALQVPAPQVPAPQGRAAAPSAGVWTMLDLRAATQATLATLLAILGGSLVSADRWYWAVFSAFVLFQGTRTRGESAAKAVAMMVGTLAGVLVALLAAAVLAGHRTAEFAVIVGGVFLAFFASTAAYGVMVFWLTVVLGLLFGLLGSLSPGLLVLRLEETVVGGAAGIAVAWLVLSRPTPNPVRSNAAAFLRALAPVVDLAVRPLLDRPHLDQLHLDRPGEVGLAAATVTLEQRYRALQAAAQPRLPGTRLLGAERTRRLLLLLSACDAWARELVRTSLHLPPRADPVLAAIATHAAARIDDSIAALATLLEGATPTPTTAPIGRREPEATPAVPEGRDDAIHAAKLLLRLDSALLHLRQRVPA